MAMTNAERMSKAMDLLKEGLLPFIERELSTQYGKYWISQVTSNWRNELKWIDDENPHLDTAALLRIMWDQWHPVFGRTLGFSERSYVSELREHRNRWAHQAATGSEETLRMLDTARLLLRAISAPQSDAIERMVRELNRIIYEEQARNERRKSGTIIDGGAETGGLKPWVEVVKPHPDVASGRYQTAEFAADLWQVHIGEGSKEYADPEEFFRRTYLTESLKQLLVGAIQRLNGDGGNPVLQLQTNFGGGKTHSMLALYHMVSGVDTKNLVGMESVMQEAEVASIPRARKVVLVGNKISPGNPTKKPDGVEVRTLWGELAWQLGGREAYEQIRLDDEQATSPGDRLRELFNTYGPCIILIDEWVAYARQLHERSDLPGGSFETQFSFAQALTESARLANHCLLVISLPASDTNTASARVEDSEVGGTRGREALHRLQNVIGRLETSWRPASAEEGFEIVRRRLFEPLDNEGYKFRDVVAKKFVQFYDEHKEDFPTGCNEKNYEDRIKAAYPIHPEIFDRLYTDWSTLLRFQRTRGVLRLMATVIHRLWEGGSKSPLILPSHIPMDDMRVQNELTRYLEEHWTPVLEKDVDGDSSLPMRLDQEKPSSGKYGASRRVARTIYLATAPIQGAANRGIDDRQVKLGCVMPGESPSIFGDALRELGTKATYLYQDGSRYWYSTQPTVRKLAEDRAEQFKREPDKVIKCIRNFVNEDIKRNERISIDLFPSQSDQIPDEKAFRLVVLNTIQTCRKGDEGESEAERAAKEMLEYRGSSVRQFRNTLAFLAPDENRMGDLESAARWYMAWLSIVKEHEQLDLKKSQRDQAHREMADAEKTIIARLGETYFWLLIPYQREPREPMQWKKIRLTGDAKEGLAVRAIHKLQQDQLLLREMGETILRMRMDEIPLWRGDHGNHVSIGQLIDDFFRYHYLDRLVDYFVLLRTIHNGVSHENWDETFAYATGYDEESGKYIGLEVGANVLITMSQIDSLLVKPEVARRQREQEAAEREPIDQVDQIDKREPFVRFTEEQKGDGDDQGGAEPKPAPEPVRRQPGRFSGSVNLTPGRVSLEVDQIEREVIQHLVKLSRETRGSITVRLEITADFPIGGAPDPVVRTVRENSQSLKFEAARFEEE